MDKIKYLSRIDLFQGLTNEELKQLEPVTPVNLVKKGTMVAAPYMEQKLLFLIKSGMVRLFKLTEGGKELTIDILGAGHLFGEIASFTTGFDHLYAETLEDSVLCTIDNEQFRRLLGERSDLALKFIELLSWRLKEIQEMLEYMAYGTARKRLLYLLHKLSQKFGVRPAAGEGESTEPEWTELQISLTHQELASMMGSIRETVTVLLSGLVSEGIMKRRAPGNPLSVQAERLKAALQECT